VKRIPSLPHHTNAITTDTMALAERHFPDHFGDLLPLHYAVTREHAFGAFDSFIEPRLQTLARFKTQWPRAHHGPIAATSASISIRAYWARRNTYNVRNAPIAIATSHLVRSSVHPPSPRLEKIHSRHLLAKSIRIQRGHHLNATRALPSLHWTSNTQMICLRQCIPETKEIVYARAPCRQDASKRRKLRYGNGSQLALFRAFKSGQPV
jgi:deoxyribodipyrimidine photolyase-related protein